MTRPAPEPHADWLALLEDARQLLLDIAGSDVVELDLEIAGARIRVRQEPGAADALEIGEREAPAETALVPIRSPLNGVFYSRPNPGAPPYVQIGDLIEVDQVVCLVEAMKSFNEIRSEVAGRVVRIVVENAQVVHAGDPLILIEPAQASELETRADATTLT